MLSSFFELQVTHMYRTVLIITLEFDAEYLLTPNSYFLLSQNINSVMLIISKNGTNLSCTQDTNVAVLA